MQEDTKRAVIKIVLIGFMLVFLIAVSSTEQYADRDITEISAVFSQAEGVSELKQGSATDLRRFYNLDPENTEGFMLYCPAGPMEVDELLILKLKDESGAQSAETAILSRWNQQKTAFEGYGAQQTGLLARYILQIRGRYVFYAVSPYAEEWKDLFARVIRA